MDNSELYCKMRKAAIPDLGMGKPPLQNYDCEGEPIEPVFITSKIFVDPEGVFYFADEEWCFQLPRQDQLQAIITEHFEANNVGDLHQYLNIFVEWFTACTGDYRIREVKTYEQLWLAFVMKELYQKRWNSARSDWVKIDG